MGGLSERAVDNERCHVGFITGTSFLSWGGLSGCAVDNERYQAVVMGASFLSWGG